MGRGPDRTSSGELGGTLADEEDADGGARAARHPGGGDGDRALVALGRAFAGALIFALPILMTMEMWWLGVTMDPGRLLLLALMSLPLLVGLAHFVGFEATFGWREDIRDALIAILVGAACSGSMLWLFGVIERANSVDEILGKVVLQTIPASIGALLAQGQLRGSGEDEEEDAGERDHGYLGELFLMAIGALFLSLNVAPTEEVSLISYQMSHGQELALAVLSLGLMHAFVYAVDFRGQERRPEELGAWALFLRFTVTGYAVVLLVSSYVLWTFGRLDGLGFEEALSVVVVIAFPGAIGAAGARLIL